MIHGRLHRRCSDTLDALSAATVAPSIEDGVARAVARPFQHASTRFASGPRTSRSSSTSGDSAASATAARAAASVLTRSRIVRPSPPSAHASGSACGRACGELADRGQHDASDDVVSSACMLRETRGAVGVSSAFRKAGRLFNRRHAGSTTGHSQSAPPMARWHRNERDRASKRIITESSSMPANAFQFRPSHLVELQSRLGMSGIRP
eukprot:6199609-Pleurochrysis_carterae.AAC.2